MDNKKTPRLYRVIRGLVRLFSPRFQTVGQLPEGPCVIVGNHSHMYGPIAGELYVPGPHYIWCAGQMMRKDEVADYAFQDFWSAKPKTVRWFYRGLSHLIVPLAVLIFNNAHTIPVYHDSRLLATFRESVRKLQEGNRLVIFPECYTPHNNIVYEFQDKFVDVARFYCKRTGEPLSFVPMYLAPALKTMFFGAPILFRPEAPIEEERTRICTELMDQITELAISLPRHTVVPYPNLSKKHYRTNIPLEVYSHETAAG